MLTALLLIASPLQNEAVVTLDLPISPLPVILKEMEVQSGEPYLVTGPERSQQVFVRVKGMPASRLRESLAEVTQGKWMRSGAGWLLQTTAEASKSDESFRKGLANWFKKEGAVPTMDRKAIEEVIKKSLQESEKVSENSMNFLAMMAQGKQSPKRRLVTRLALALGLNDLATISEDERRVYAVNPTSLQRQLPATAGSAVSQYIAESRAFIEAVQRLAPETDGNDERMYNPLVDPYRGGEIPKAPATLLLVARRMMGSLMIEVKFYDNKGLLTDQESDSIGSSFFEEMMEAAPGKVEDMVHPALKGMDVPLALSADDKSFANDLRKAMTFMGGAPSSPISEVTKNRLLNMDKMDPLLFGPTQMLVQLADHKKKQVVAKVTDLAIFSVAFGMDMNQEPTLTTAVSLALGAFGTKPEGIKEGEDLLTLRPTSSALLPFSMSIDRPSTSRYLRVVAAKEDSLDALAGLALNCRSSMDMQLPVMLGTILGAEGQMFYDDGSFNLLKLYGMLDPNQKQRVKQGGLDLNLGALVGPMAAQARKMLLGGDRFGGMGVSMAMSSSHDSDDEEGPMMDDMGQERYEDEITVKLARLPAHLGVLRITMESKDALFMKVGSGPMQAHQEANATAVAYALVTAEMSPGEGYATVHGFSNGTQRTLTSSFIFGKETLQSDSMQAPLFPRNSKLMKLTDLPAAFQEEVKKEMAEARSNMQSMPRGDGGGPVKPPA